MTPLTTGATKTDPALPVLLGIVMVFPSMRVAIGSVAPGQNLTRNRLHRRQYWPDPRRKERHRLRPERLDAGARNRQGGEGGGLLARHAQALLAGGHYAEPAALGQEALGQGGARGENVLAVVEHQQRVAL